MDGVVPQEMRVGLNRPEVVDGDDLDVLAAGFDDGAQNVAADAAESVDPDPDGHRATPYWFLPSIFNAAAATASAVMPKCL